MKAMKILFILACYGTVTLIVMAWLGSYILMPR